MKIIAFGHRQGVGKDTAARFLISHLRTSPHGRHLSIMKAGFADKLKAIAYDLYKWAGLQPAEFYEDPAHQHLKREILPAMGKSPRDIWIALGNGVREWIWEATWLDNLLNNTRCDLLVVKDMRFPVEANEILRRRGQIYRIDRPDIPKYDDGADDPLVGFSNWSGIISNAGSLGDFHGKIVAIAESLVSKVGP